MRILGKTKREKKWLDPDAYTMRIRISFSLRFIFLMMLRRPILEAARRRNQYKVRWRAESASLLLTA
jgi:hypothetical protein